MGFLTGRMTCLRLKPSGPAPRQFDQEHIDALADRAAGRQRAASADGVEVGWTAGASILDTAFDLAKNVVNDALCFELRVETDKPPTDLLKAYYHVELQALTKDNPSGFASIRQKREAKEAARDRIEEEAKDGRFKKRKCVPVLWDRTTNEVLFGATSFTQVDRFCFLFEQTFGVGLWCVTAGPRAALLKGHSHYVAADSLGQVEPAKFFPAAEAPDIAWIAGEENSDFLGNEFLLWLWHLTDTVTDTVLGPDGSEITLMLARQLVVDCPRGQTGTDGFKTEGPSRLPEARRAVQTGKLPRKAGITAVRHGEQYEFALHAETLGIGSMKLPAGEESKDARARLDDRVTQIRESLVTIDQLYGAFVSVRLSGYWPETLVHMRSWLNARQPEGAERS